MPKVPGSTKYKDIELLSAVRKFLPVGGVEWEKVAKEYQKNSAEAKIRDPADLKRHFYNAKGMCNKNKKVTGSTDKDKFANECLNVAAAILRKQSVGIAGGDDDDDEDDEDEGVDEEEETQDAEDTALILDEFVDGDFELEQTQAAVETDPSGNVVTAAFKKRKAEKPATKNSVPTGAFSSPRNQTSKAIRSMGEAVQQMANQSQFEMMLRQQEKAHEQAMRQQETQQQAMMMMMQQQSQQMMMMMAMMGNRGPMMSAALPPAMPMPFLSTQSPASTLNIEKEREQDSEEKGDN